MRRIFLLGFTFLSLLVVACSKDGGSSGGGGNTGGGGGGTNPTPVVPIISLPAGWKFNASYSTNFPNGIQTFSFDTIFNGRTVKAFCLAFDTKLGLYDLKPVQSTTAKKVSEFVSQEPGIVFGGINGGFFGGNSSYSIVKYNNQQSSINIKSVNRTYNGASTAYFPTRAAFGIRANGSPTTAWIYHVGSGNDNIYSYPTPSPNAEGSAPQPTPTENFPAGGTPWSVPTAIGGSPMLLKDGQVNISDVAELININNATSRPRSAIGHTSNGIVLLLAVEGDNSTAGYPGINLADLANMLRQLGCTDAINLDGGGSTSLVAAGRLTVRPGDNGAERPVVSAVLIKQK